MCFAIELYLTSQQPTRMFIKKAATEIDAGVSPIQYATSETRMRRLIRPFRVSVVTHAVPLL